MYMQERSLFAMANQQQDQNRQRQDKELGRRDNLRNPPRTGKPKDPTFESGTQPGNPGQGPGTTPRPTHPGSPQNPIGDPVSKPDVIAEERNKSSADRPGQQPGRGNAGGQQPERTGGQDPGRSANQDRSRQTGTQQGERSRTPDTDAD
jgi:hypothetical protein